MRHLAVSLLAAGAIAGGIAPAGAQVRVGIDSAVNAEASATPPGGIARRITIGEPVLFNERFATNAGGQTQILFLDRSAMTIGPNSDVTIDEFAYDPGRGTGRLAMSATRGILRFVGGKLSKQANGVTLRTPTATLAVRGGEFLADLSAGGRLDVYFIYGVGVSVTGTNGATQVVSRPGFGITVAGPGAVPAAPYRMPPGALAGLLTALNGRPGATGGTAHPPSNATIASSGIGTVISGNFAASIAAVPQPQERPHLLNLASLQHNLQVDTVQGQGTPGIALLQGNRSVSSNATTPTTPTQTSYPLAAFAAIDTTTIFGGHAHRHAVGGPATAVLQNGVLTASASTAAVSFPLTAGFGTFGPQGTSSTFGAITGSGWLAPDNAFFYAEGTSAAYTNKLGIVVGGIPTVNLPTAGTGSFSGSMTGLVDNNGSIYLANGNFTNVYNFASGTGTFTINSFDGKRLSGSVSAVGTALAHVQTAATAVSLPSNFGNLVYTGRLTGSGLRGFVAGAFFGANANDTGGGFGIGSPSGAYKAGGLFGGHR